MDDNNQRFIERLKNLRAEGTWKSRQSHLKQFDE